MRHKILKALIFISIITYSANISAEKAKLQSIGKTQQLIVDNKPFIILGGELSNSSATSETDIEKIFPELQKMGLNTVLVPAYWDLIEPQKGKFDFKLVDKILSQATINNLKIIFLWYGVWKNSTSCYTPLWFKSDALHYQRAYTSAGKPLEIASTFSENIINVECNAFGNFIQHIRENDTNNNVIMIQLESSIGMVEDARDHCLTANELYQQEVPAELIKYMTKNKDSLHKKLLSKWEKTGYKTNGTWSEIFGNDIYTDEIFMAYHYALYIEKLAKISKFNYNIPIYVNATLNNSELEPGKYPSGGPLAHVIDIWRCGAPSIDIFAPNIYNSNFTYFAKEYIVNNNPLFIPEMQLSDANAAQTLYTIGEYDAIGVSPFSIEKNKNEKLTLTYNKIKELTPLLAKYQGQNFTYGLLLDKENKDRIIEREGVRITCSHGNKLQCDNDTIWASNKSSKAGGLIICMSNDEYIIVGNNINITFESIEEPTNINVVYKDGYVIKSDTNNINEKWTVSERIGIGYVDDVSISNNGSINYNRRLNGNETNQGRNISINADDFKILHVKLYKYK